MKPEQQTRAGSPDEALLRSIFDAAPCPLMVIDAAGVIEAVSAAAERLFGYEAAELVGREIGRVIDARDRPMADRLPRNEAVSGCGVPDLTPGEAASGEVAGGEVLLGTAAQDEVVRGRAELGEAALGEVVRDTVVRGGAALGEMAPGAAQRRAVPPRGGEVAHRRIAGAGRVTSGFRRNGKRFPIEVTVDEVRAAEAAPRDDVAPGVGPDAGCEASRRLIVFIRDLTEHQATQARLRELQEDLVHVSRLRAMGQMAAALSHELNQPLTATTNYLNAAGRMIEQPEPDLPRIRQAVSLATQQTMRSGEIIRRLRAFVARGEVVRRPESIGRIVEEAGALALVDARDHGVTFALDASPDLPPVLVDRVQIQQVVLNLVRNAVEAMDGMDERVMSITACLWDSMIAVSVCDTGSGISPAIEAQLFQPFVTTKRDGMGIGLSVCRTIVEAHGGRLWAEPRAGGGTMFQFTVPLAPGTGQGTAPG